MQREVQSTVDGGLLVVDHLMCLSLIEMDLPGFFHDPVARFLRHLEVLWIFEES
jgi:hypothetical protein